MKAVMTVMMLVSVMVSAPAYATGAKSCGAGKVAASSVFSGKGIQAQAASEKPKAEVKSAQGK
jgi:hypothetical protein